MQIKLSPDTFPVFPLVKAVMKDGNWVIQDIELYADFERTKLIADDVAKDLPPSAIDAVFAGIYAWDHERMRISRRLMREMQVRP